MNNIRISNFRKFRKDVGPVEYGGITFFVGKNNSGKSTVAKALLLVNNYLRSGVIDKFSFGNNMLEDANFVTFGRAKNTADEFIMIVCNLDQYYIEISLSGDDDDTQATVELLYITDRKYNLNFFISPVDNRIEISKTRTFPSEQEEAINANLKSLDDKIDDLKISIKASDLKKSSRDYILLIEELNSLEKKKSDLTLEQDSLQIKDEFYVETEFHRGLNLQDTIAKTIEEVLQVYEREFNSIQQGNEPAKNFEDYRWFKENLQNINNSLATIIFRTIYSNLTIYLGASTTKQSALFQIRDKNNALAQAIHDYAQLYISAGTKIYQFVEKWMKVFGVGDKIEITLHAGEAYEVKVTENDHTVQLADKGMGSIQAMLLILRLASVLENPIQFIRNTTVIIEEPELNLHPQLQSKLADLFLEVNQEYGINFIIETHSEYILRRSQVLVAEKEFEVKPNENPFRVYYFPTEEGQQPYRLEYDKNGVFNRNFGEGFFDEASANTLELLKLKRQKDS